LWVGFNFAVKLRPLIEMFLENRLQRYASTTEGLHSSSSNSELLVVDSVMRVYSLVLKLKSHLDEKHVVS
jgi:hypothetical protein